MKKCNECIKNVFILSVRFRFLLFVLHLIMILKFAYLEPILTTLEMWPVKLNPVIRQLYLLWHLLSWGVTITMFWRYNSVTVSHLDTLLDKQGVTLQEILEQEDIIEECKNQNKKLVDL